MPVTVDELNQQTSINVREVLESQGISAETLARGLKRELAAKETKLVSIDGQYRSLQDIILTVAAATLDEKTLKKLKRLANGPVRILGASGEKTLVAVDMVNWGTRQKARMDAQKLLDMYPVEKKQIQLDEGTLSAILN
ncbi:MAG: hypothetical protein LLF89_06850, partial [Spirochaetaceae bacterium]|nr:hypothetical protein [Spirochaetaceae bacterium]